MKLIPRKFKIEQDKNEHTYYVEWKKTEKGGKWFIAGDVTPEGLPPSHCSALRSEVKEK